MIFVKCFGSAGLVSKPMVHSHWSRNEAPIPAVYGFICIHLNFLSSSNDSGLKLFSSSDTHTLLMSMHLIFYCDVFRLCCLTKIGFHQECDSHAFVADLTKSIRVGKILPLFPPSLLGGHVYNVCKWHERALFWVYVWINYSQETLKLEYLEGSRRNQPFDRVCLECLEETPTNCGSSGKSCSWRRCRERAKNIDEIAEYLIVFCSEKCL